MRRILDQLGIRREDQPVLYRIALIAVLLLASNGATFSLLDHEYEASLRTLEAKSQASASEVSSQPSPTPVTEEEVYLGVIEHWAVIGGLLPPVDANEQRAARRRWVGDQVCSLITMLALSDRDVFREVIEAGCAVLRRWWPDRAPFCAPCGN